MPYWSSSRVGAVPQGQTTKANERSSRYNRQKGITMEDLKKQTALRLAQEHQKQHQQGNVSTSLYPVVPPPTTQPSAKPIADRYYEDRPPSATSQSTAKLPHGLTVQELKEMTKARLQAEAAGKKDGILPVSLDYRDQLTASPLPVSNGNRQRTFSQGRDSSWSQDSQRIDTWETGSVGTAASDYLGSFCGDDPSPSPYNRNPVYPSPNNGVIQNFTDQPPPESVALPGVPEYASPPIKYYDAVNSSSQNRRRAATLSPRLGHLDEYRQVLPSHEVPVIPSHFTTPSNVRLYPSADRYNRGPNAVGLMDSNRQRTSSAVSLPAMSHTAEEFCADSPFHRLPSNIGTLREEASSPSVTGLADVFRDSHEPNAPPGFGNRSRVNTSSSIGFADPLEFGDPRHRAATWSEPSSDSMFDPSLFQQHELCDDLASILKLSGAEETSKPIGGHDLFSPPGIQ